MVCEDVDRHVLNVLTLNSRSPPRTETIKAIRRLFWNYATARHRREESH